MTETSFGSLALRMIISLSLVLAFMFIAYRVIRKRQGFSSGAVKGPKRSGGLFSAGTGRSSSARRPRRVTSARHIGSNRANASATKGANSKRALRVVGRISLGRTSQVVAVQFGEQVFLLSASDHAAPTVLSHVEADAWFEATAATEDDEERIPLLTASTSPNDGAAFESADRRNFMANLREATVRRA
jgi:flagellar biogenesis protein FliO